MERVPFFSLFCVVLLLLSSDSFKALFAFFHLRFLGTFCTFSLYLQSFPSIGKRYICFVTSFDLPLSLSLSLSRPLHIHARERGKERVLEKKGEKARFLRETEFVFESC